MIKRVLPSVLLGATLTATMVVCAASPVTVHAENQLERIIGVSSQPFNIAGPGPARFALKVSPAAASTRGGRIEFLLHRRVSNRGPFRAIALGQVEAGVVDSVSTPLSRVPRDNTGLLTPTIAIRTRGSTPTSLTIQFDGVYPLTIRVIDPDGQVVASTMTFLNRREPGSTGSPVRVTTLVRIASVPSIGTDGFTSISDVTRAAVRRATAFLAAAPANLTVVVEPELIAALAAAVEPGDEQLFLGLREQLRRRAIVSATFARMSPSDMVARGLEREFTEQLALGESVLDRYLPGVTIRRSTWVALDPLDANGVALLQRAGIRHVILATGAQVGLASSKPIDVVSAIRTRGVDPMPLVAADPLLAEAASASSTYPQQDGYRIAAEAIVVRDDLIAAGVPSDRIRVVLSTVTSSIYDNSALFAATTAIASSPGFSPVDMALPETVSDSDPEVIPPAPRKPQRDRAATALASLRTQMNAVASMLPDDDSRHDSWKYVYGLAASSSPEDPWAYIDALRSTLRATIESVSVTTPGSINLSSRNGTIRFQVRNNSDTELTVRVRVASVKFRIPKPSIEVTLVPGGTTDVSFAGTTLTNGRFPIAIRIQTPEGNRDVVPTSTVTARVSAVAGFGQLVSVTLLLLLLAWWWSNRRSTRANGVNSEPGPHADTVGSQ